MVNVSIAFQLNFILSKTLLTVLFFEVCKTPRKPTFKCEFVLSIVNL
jgi:hypothetical protein